MCRYFVIVMIIFLNLSNVFANNLDEQFQLWMEGQKNEQDCFNVNSDFLYCLNQNVAKQFILIDDKGQEVYQIYWFDNGPDYDSEGLYRIKQNNKIGYASAVTGGSLFMPNMIVHIRSKMVKRVLV